MPRRFISWTAAFVASRVRASSSGRSASKYIVQPVK
jgi:hypothetical protein